MTADPGARGDNWRRVPGEFGTDGSSGGGTSPAGAPARGRRGAAIFVLILGLAGLAVSVFGVAVQLLPRHVTASQQRQIQAWEVIRRWQTMPAGQVFPASISYQLSAEVLKDTIPLNLDALRVSIAHQESDCAKAVTGEPAAAALRRNGCEAVLRATYVDATRSYVITVGIAVLPNAAAATSAATGLVAPRNLTIRTPAGSRPREPAWCAAASRGATSPVAALVAAAAFGSTAMPTVIT